MAKRNRLDAGELPSAPAHRRAEAAVEPQPARGLGHGEESTADGEPHASVERELADLKGAPFELVARAPAARPRASTASAIGKVQPLHLPCANSAGAKVDRDAATGKLELRSTRTPAADALLRLLARTACEPDDGKGRHAVLDMRLGPRPGAARDRRSPCATARASTPRR